MVNIEKDLEVKARQIEERKKYLEQLALRKNNNRAVEATLSNLTRTTHLVSPPPAKG